MLIRGQAGIAKVGITDHAQRLLGDLVYVGLPKIGTTFAKGAIVATVESVKAASDIYAPLSGEIIEINEKLIDQPDLVNRSAMAEGWFFTLKLSCGDELRGLLDQKAYTSLVQGA